MERSISSRGWLQIFAYLMLSLSHTLHILSYLIIEILSTYIYHNPHFQSNFIHIIIFHRNLLIFINIFYVNEYVLLKIIIDVYLCEHFDRNVMG